MRDVNDKVKKKIVDKDFPRLKFNDDYCSQIGHIDVADQLRYYYWIEHWMGKIKMVVVTVFGVGVGVLIVNNIFIENNGLSYMSQYNIRRKFFLVYIEPKEFFLIKRG